MKNTKILNGEELEKVTGGTNEDLENQINEALNEVIVPNPTTEKFQNKFDQSSPCDIGLLGIPDDSPILK